MPSRRPFQFVLPLSVAAAVLALVSAAARSPVHPVPPAPPESKLAEVHDVAARVNEVLARIWSDRNVVPARPADELQVLRRLSLALHGGVPSLEEIRRFEGDTAPDRLERWTIQMLNDRRFADYFSVRLARGFVGAEGGQFIIFRRDRFTNWLADEIHKNTPLDQLVRQMIADNGLWTGVPATNFITQAFADDILDYNKLAGRTVRAFLGQRIDCAQCHNHPFADWKQAQFEGLAACYGQARITATGVGDDPTKEYRVTDRMTQEERQVAPAVPFGEEWWPADGTPRARLAAWVTHPDNRRFERAIVNRTWGLLFGRAWSEPVDDLPDPPTVEDPHDILSVLGHDFRNHNCDLKRLIFLIASSQAFQLSSEHPAYDSGERIDDVEATWAAFPLVRLRPEQMIGALCQSSSIKTIDQNSHLFTRFLRFIREQDFVKEYGDLGERELEERSGTIPQALLRLNGRFARETAEASPFSASGRISGMAPTDDAAIETAYLCCLSRRPTTDELAHFRALLTDQQGDNRSQVIEDLYWVLFNSPEFCWNH
ncbi:MAG: DUF1553 domain-containing protein [Planctomycetaceae bacterium]|nr:DUF1553 domain-containing protein [Planctomycetaceae bacterium]